MNIKLGWKSGSAAVIVRIGYICLVGLVTLGCSDADHDHKHGSESAEASSVESVGPERADPPLNGSGVEAMDAYLRQPAPGQSMLAAFVTFRNNSDHAYTLNHIRSPRAASVTVHRTLYEDGVMTMRPVTHLVVSPHSELVFKPGGYHLMLSGLEDEFNAGDQIPLSFSFAGGTTLNVTAEVRALR